MIRSHVIPCPHSGCEDGVVWAQIDIDDVAGQDCPVCFGAGVLEQECLSCNDAGRIGDDLPCPTCGPGGLHDHLRGSIGAPTLDLLNDLLHSANAGAGRSLTLDGLLNIMIADHLVARLRGDQLQADAALAIVRRAA